MIATLGNAYPDFGRADIDPGGVEIDLLQTVQSADLDVFRDLFFFMGSFLLLGSVIDSDPVAASSRVIFQTGSTYATNEKTTSNLNHAFKRALKHQKCDGLEGLNTL